MLDAISTAKEILKTVNRNSGTVDIPHVLRIRHKMIEENRALLDRAEEEGRDLSAKESKTFDERTDLIDTLGGLVPSDFFKPAPVVSMLAEPGYGAPATQGTRLLTRDGKEVRLLGPEDSIRSTIPSGHIGANLSLGRLVRGMVLQDWEGAHAELEAVRALGEGTPGLGGYLVPTPLSSTIIDMARNQAGVFRAGAQTIPMDSQTLTVAKVLSDPTAAWRGEHAPIDESDPTFGAIELRAKTLAAMVRVSVELIEDAANLEEVLNNLLSQAVALELDRVALRGSGEESEPLGIRNTSGIHLIDAGGPIGYAPFSRAAQAVAESNGTATAAIYAPRTFGEMDRLTDSTGQPLAAPRSFTAMRQVVSNQVPTDLGTDENESEAYVGDFRNVWVGMRTSARLEASRVAGDAFKNLQVLLRIYLRADVAVVRPQHLAVIHGIEPEQENG